MGLSEMPDKHRRPGKAVLPLCNGHWTLKWRILYCALMKLEIIVEAFAVIFLKEVGQYEG